MGRSVGQRSVKPFTFAFDTDEYRSIPIPGIKHAKMGTCFVKVTDLPPELADYMSVNPRTPKRNAKDALTGDVVNGILATLRGAGDQMAIKNLGVYLLAEDTEFSKQSGGRGVLKVTLTDPTLHGVVNGGHTYMAIREAVENTDSEAELEQVDRAYVRLHIMQGIPRDAVTDIADGLNRNKPVDLASLFNLDGAFEQIKSVMRGHIGENKIAYKQGEEGPQKPVYVTEILTYMQLFNAVRYSRTKHPNALYRNKSIMLRDFKDDYKDGAEDSPIQMIVPRLPEILKLADDIRFHTPANALALGFTYGNAKVDKNGKPTKLKDPIQLNFSNHKVEYRTSNGWVIPMLAAFRANVNWDTKSGEMRWIIPLDILLPLVIRELVSVCVAKHRSKVPAEEVAVKEESFAQCYDKVLLQLALMGKVSQETLSSR